MRSREFLSDSVLRGTSSASWLGYLKNMLTASSLAIGEKGEKDSGLTLTDASKTIIKSLIKSIEVNGVDPKDIKDDIENTSLSFGNGKSYLIKQIFKGPEIKSGTGDASATEKKYWNDGEVAETLLGAALFARFTSKQNITEAEVIKTLSSASQISGGFELAGKRGTDPINLRAINKPQNNDVIIQYVNDKSTLVKKFPKSVAGLDIALRSCVAYVNESSKVSEAIQEIDSNPDKDSVEVVTDGVSDQTGTKADLQLKIGDKLRLLSLKVNAVKQFGQDTGATADVITTFFRRFIPDAVVDPVVVSNWPNLSAAKKEKNNAEAVAYQVYSSIGSVYQSINQQLQAKLSNATNATEIISNLYNGIIHHAQGGSAGQTLVILNPGGKSMWKELEFGAPLLQALKSFRIESSVAVAGVDGETNHILKIFGRPADSKASVAMTTTINNPKQAADAAVDATKKRRAPVDPEMLMQLRSYVQEAGLTIRNIVEMGPLLKSITEVQAINNAPVPAPAQDTAELDRVKNLAGIPQKPPQPGPNTTTMKGNSMQSPTPASITNQNRTLATKIPMGTEPAPTMPQ
jgi:hypothetical protein